MDQHLYDSSSYNEQTPSSENAQNENDAPPKQTPEDDGNGSDSKQPSRNQGEPDSQDQSPEDKSQADSEQSSNHNNTEQPDTSNQQESASPASDHPPENVFSDSSDAKPKPLSPQERDRLNTQWQQRLAGAAQQAAQAGKLNGSVARLVERLLRSSVPWRSVLARYMSGSARIDYNINRPSQRREGDAIMPSLHTKQINVVVAIDTSGSIENDELNEFVAEVNAIKGLVNAQITLLACDAQLDSNGPWEYEPWEQFKLPDSLQGSGGTNFSPVFEWIQNQNRFPDLIIYFTDAKGQFPERPPATETLWLVKGSAAVPWGQRIQLN